MPYLAANGNNPGRGYDFDTLADDLGALLEHLDLTGTTLVGHSRRWTSAPG